MLNDVKVERIRSGHRKYSVLAMLPGAIGERTPRRTKTHSAILVSLQVLSGTLLFRKSRLNETPPEAGL